MKKIIFIIMILTLTFFVVSCGEDVRNIEPQTHIYPRTEDVSAGIKKEGQEFEYKADFDFDGEKEEIEIDVESYAGDEWSSELEISVGDYDSIVEISFGSIDAVYICDIDENDGARDLVVITNEMSGDPVVRIMKYDSGLPQYKFVSDFDNEAYEDNWMGYAVSYYFNVNDDGSITLEEQTESAGMWSVYKTYYRNSEGNFEERKPEYYEVLPDFMERGPALSEPMGDEEREMWDKGYIMAHTDYTSNGFTLYEGEYFRVLYDDGNNNLYVEKENGEGAWINMDYSMERYDLNQNFFYLAG